MALAQAGQSFVGAFEREGPSGGPHRDARGEREKFFGIAASEVRDGTEAAFLPKEFIREGGEVGHMYPAANDNAAFVERFESSRNEAADGRENEGRVEFGGRQRVAAPGPGCA